MILSGRICTSFLKQEEIFALKPLGWMHSFSSWIAVLQSTTECHSPFRPLLESEPTANTSKLLKQVSIITPYSGKNKHPSNQRGDVVLLTSRDNSSLGWIHNSGQQNRVAVFRFSSNSQQTCTNCRWHGALEGLSRILTQRRTYMHICHK